MLRLDGSLRPDALMRSTGMTLSPMALLEIQGPKAWLLISTGFVEIRVPTKIVEGSNADVPGPLGAVFDTLKQILKYKQREYFMQCDVNSVEFYDETKRPIARVARGTHRDEFTSKMRTIERPAYEYPLVVGVKPAQIMQASRAMGDPYVLYLHMDPVDGSVNKVMRVSPEPFGGNDAPHGYLAPIPLPLTAARTHLEKHVTTAEVAAKVRVTHPWYDPVKPVEPLAPLR